MSWIVEHLVRNRDTIRSVYGNEGGLDSDVYNNLLILESKIDELHNSGVLSDLDIIILESVNDIYLRDKLSTIIKDRHTYSRVFSQICERISYFLGGYFTDDGFLESMAIGYGLTEEQVDIIRKYMSSRFRHKMIRRTTDNG